MKEIAILDQAGRPVGRAKVEVIEGPALERELSALFAFLPAPLSHPFPAPGHADRAPHQVEMTWPQYRRHECRIAGHVVTLTAREAEILLLLLLRYPRPTRSDDLIEMVHTDPDSEPDFAKAALYLAIMKLRRKIGEHRLASTAQGYRLCQTAADVVAAVHTPSPTKDPVP